MTSGEGDAQGIGGRGKSNGVNYSFHLKKKPWFANYDCHVNRDLLNVPLKKVCTKAFEVGGHTWSVTLHHTSQGYLAAYLNLKSRGSVTVRFSFTLVNHTNELDNVTKGAAKTLIRGKGWGLKKLESISRLSDPLAGFVDDDQIVVKLCLRVKSCENEWHSLVAESNSATFKWRLKHVKEMSPWILSSEEFTIANLKWHVQLRPNGIKEGDEHLAAYLFSSNEASAFVKYSIIAVNHQSQEKNVSGGKPCEDSYIFTSARKGHGWRKFMSTKLLENGSGFVKDDWFTLVVRVTIKDQHLKVHRLPLLVTHPQMQDEEEPKCIYCLEKSQTSGVLHGATTHKCYCLDCAKMFKQHKDLRCPLCRAKVDRIIERFF